MTTPQDLDRERARSVYDADMHHLNLPADEPRGANHWPGIIALFAVVMLTSLAFLVGCTSPSAQVEAEAVAADVQDAQTAAMQAAIDKRCASVRVHEQLACAVDALAELQPDRWTPEEVARGHEAARIAGAER